nr:VOC family protein [Rhodoferax sp.]
MAFVDPMAASMDHLVVMASDLAQGVAWCEATLGVTPGPGGEHPLMGTHNRLLKIATPEHRTVYLEIIAINSVAPNAVPARARRWFDMDDLALQAHVAHHGPTLIHFVASVPDIVASVFTLAAQGIDRGAAVRASRPTASGLLQWQISVRDDGERLFDGCLPTLIQWGHPQDSAAAHPTDAMLESGVTLLSLHVQHPQATVLNAAYRSLHLSAITADIGPARLSARLQTPKGVVTLHTP